MWMCKKSMWYLNTITSSLLTMDYYTFKSETVCRMIWIHMHVLRNKNVNNKSQTILNYVNLH